MKSFIGIILFSIFITFTSAQIQKERLKIGAFFFKDEMDLAAAFDTAVQDINDLNLEFNMEFDPIKHYLSEDDSVLLQELTCQMLEEGVAAIFGPSSTSTSDIVSVLCNMTGIPHIQYDWHGDEMDMIRNNYKYTVNVAPSIQVLSGAIHDILRSRGVNWHSFTIVYEASTDLSRMQHLLAWRQYHKMGIKVVKFQRDDDFRVLWKIVKNSRERNVVLDCPQDILVEVMNASIYFNMTGPFNSFILTGLDTHLSGIESLLANNVTANITAIRLRPFIPSPARSELDVFQLDDQEKIRTLKAQCLYDAVVLLFNALKQEFEPNPVPIPSASCRGGTWGVGHRVIHKMKKINSKDIRPHYKTQKLVLNSYGIRNDFNLELYEPMTERIVNVWNKKRGVVSYDELIARSTKVIKTRKGEGKEDNKTVKYTVATRFGAPYFMLREEPEGVHLEGNERFEGYAVDLMYELGKVLTFEVIFEPVPDNNYGSHNPITDEWDGIIRQLIDNQAQLGICDLTITQSRRTVVDFTVPFMQLGVQILHYKSPPPKKELFQFLEPFSMEVWLCLLVAILVMSLVFVVLARLCPTEWKEDGQNNNNTSATIQWTLRNSLHLHISSILQVGCDILPTAGPVRLFTTFWWIFALLMAQTYLAKMTSFITASKMEGSITNLHDLVHQNKIQFGTIKGGSTSTFFSESNETEYRLAWNKMISFKPEAFTDDNKGGVDRVTLSKGKYAFLVETPNLQYYLQKNCDLTPIGEPFGEKFYGIALPLHAPYRTQLSVGLLKMSENGMLYKIKKKWFNQGTCEEGPKAEESQMDMHTMRGVFVVLIAGLLLALLIGIGEFFWYVRKKAVMDKIRSREAIKADLKFFIRFWIKYKPLKIYNAPDSGSKSRGSLLPSSNTTTEITTKEKRKNAKRKKSEQNEK